MGPFEGSLRWLSNFWPCVIQYDGATYPSVEHAYQAAKCAHPEDRTRFECGTAGQAKRLGRSIELRSDWMHVRRSVMLELLRLKFAAPALRTLLHATGVQPIREVNYWGDQYWGVDLEGRGLNHLGALLEQLRAESQTPPANC